MNNLLETALIQMINKHNCMVREWYSTTYYSLGINL